ncbi:MAG: hypothetical protein JW714_04360 [Candidatus Omnitrophica bacterium]|nr:hypothetical protein [Candidatus Omnitrophota bacterium]
MKWEEFLNIAGELPFIETEILLAGMSDAKAVKVQISRWQQVGKIIQLKRGVYLLAAPYRKVKIFEPSLASVLKKPSYLSLEKALEYYDLIPEAVPVYTSVTTKRPRRFTSAAGIFDYRHIKTALFWGYSSVTVNQQTGFIASPEKALLDFFYLKGVKVSVEYLSELRLQNVSKIDLQRLFDYGRRFKKPGILSVCAVIEKYIEARKEEEKTL